MAPGVRPKVSAISYSFEPSEPPEGISHDPGPMTFRCTGEGLKGDLPQLGEFRMALGNAAHASARASFALAAFSRGANDFEDGVDDDVRGVILNVMTGIGYEHVSATRDCLGQFVVELKFQVLL